MCVWRERRTPTPGAAAAARCSPSTVRRLHDAHTSRPLATAPRHRAACQEARQASTTAHRVERRHGVRRHHRRLGHRRGRSRRRGRRALAHPSVRRGSPGRRPRPYDSLPTSRRCCIRRDGSRSHEDASLLRWMPQRRPRRQHAHAYRPRRRARPPPPPLHQHPMQRRRASTARQREQSRGIWLTVRHHRDGRRARRKVAIRCTPWRSSCLACASRSVL